MKLYADLPAQRTRQVVADVLVLAWVLLWVQVARTVHEVISRLAAPGRTLEQAGTNLEDGLASVGESMADVPLLGDQLRAPFDAAGGAAGSITQAGIDLQAVVAQVATVAAWWTAGWPILVVVTLWLVRRIRFARRAGAARTLVAAGADLDLFALRALARLPLTTLAAVSADPAGDWRRGDPAVVRHLAALELRSVGLKPPSARPGTAVEQA